MIRWRSVSHPRFVGRLARLPNVSRVADGMNAVIYAFIHPLDRIENFRLETEQLTTPGTPNGSLLRFSCLEQTVIEKAIVRTQTSCRTRIQVRNAAIGVILVRDQR